MHHARNTPNPSIFDAAAPSIFDAGAAFFPKSSLAVLFV
jgi:hypothetical protein